MTEQASTVSAVRLQAPNHADLRWREPDIDAWQDYQVCPECCGAGDMPGIFEGDDDQPCAECGGTGKA